MAMVVSMALISALILVVVGFIQDSSSDIRNSDVLDSELEEVKLSCSQTCNEVSAREGEDAFQKAVEYCVERFSVGKSGERAGNGYNSYCSDGVRCFNVNSCSFQGTELNAQGCREILCKSFEDSENQEERVKDYYEKNRAEGDFGAGTCDLSNVEDSAGYSVSTWWTENYGDVNSICE